jgi:hypothetical protein
LERVEILDKKRAREREISQAEGEGGEEKLRHVPLKAQSNTHALEFPSQFGDRLDEREKEGIFDGAGSKKGENIRIRRKLRWIQRKRRSRQRLNQSLDAVQKHRQMLFFLRELQKQKECLERAKEERGGASLAIQIMGSERDQSRDTQLRPEHRSKKQLHLIHPFSQLSRMAIVWQERRGIVGERRCWLRGEEVGVGRDKMGEQKSE